MKNILLLVVAFAANFSYVSKAAAFATQDMPPVKAMITAENTAKPHAYGARVKLDLSYNRCVERGQEDYKTTLFYEEFDSMSECLKSKDRG